MSAEKSLALVLKVVDFSETSRVITLLTRDFGKIRALAKGARRLRGPFEAGLDLLSVCRIVFLRRRAGTLNLLTEAQLLKRFRGREGHLGSLYAAYYVAELLAELTEDDDPHPELFDEAVGTLDWLSDAAIEPALAVMHFELAALTAAGYRPALDRCVQCQRPGPGARRVSFSVSAGGLVCSDCRPGKSKVVSITAGTLGILRQLAAPERQIWQRLQPDAQGLREARSLISASICHVIGRQPRMLPYLRTL